MVQAFKNELRPTLSLALPMICTQLLNYGQQIIDTVMAGRHTPLTLAGVSLANQLFAIVYLFMIGIGVGFSALISRRHGNDSHVTIRREFQQGFWLFSLLGILMIFAVIGCAYLPQIIGSEKSIAEESKRYLLVLALPAGIFLLGQLARFFLEGMANPRPINYVQAALLPVNIVGNWFFLTFTDLGAAGMAISTGFCYVLYTGALLWILATRPRWRRYRLFHKMSAFNLPMIKELLWVGLPIGAAMVMEAAMFSYIGIMASRENAIITSANQIASNYLSIIFMVPLGIASALTIRCAHALGRRDWTAIRYRAYTGMIFSGGFMLLSSIVLILARYYIPLFYTDHPEIIAIAAKILFMVAFFEFIDGIQVSCAGILRGLGDTRICLLYAFIGYWIIGIPTGTIMAYGFDWGVYGLWGGCAFGLGTFAVLGARRVFYHTHRKRTLHAEA